MAELIEGAWKATEIFSDDHTKAKFRMELSCLGRQVRGMLICESGRFDKGAEFVLSGSFTHNILMLLWEKKKSIESGTITVRLVEDKKLEDHGLYIALSNGQVYTSKFTATKKP